MKNDIVIRIKKRGFRRETGFAAEGSSVKTDGTGNVIQSLGRV